MPTDRAPGSARFARLRADHDPDTMTATLTDVDTGAVLWSGPSLELPAAVQAIRDEERRAEEATPQQVIARDVVASGDPRGEIVADRILAALGAAGLAVVPREPTMAMLNAAADKDAWMFEGGSAHGASNDDIWRAMVEAADGR